MPIDKPMADSVLAVDDNVKIRTMFDLAQAQSGLKWQSQTRYGYRNRFAWW